MRMHVGQVIETLAKQAVAQGADGKAVLANAARAVVETAQHEEMLALKAKHERDLHHFTEWIGRDIGPCEGRKVRTANGHAATVLD